MGNRLKILILHALVGALSLMLAFALRFYVYLHPIPDQYLQMMWISLPFAVLAKLITAEVFGLNRGLWKYASVRDLVQILQMAAGATLILIPVVLVLIGHGFPRLVFFLDFVSTVALFSLVRLMGRQWIRQQTGGWFHPASEGVPTLIVGAGDAGELALRQLGQQPARSHRVVGFLDDDPNKKGLAIHGVPILGPTVELRDWIQHEHVATVLIAIRNPGRELLNHINTVCGDLGVGIRILPTLQDLLTGEIEIKPVRELRLEDLLGREPVHLDPEPLTRALAGKRILVTGAGGSIGSELCRQITAFAPESLCLLDHSENALFDIEQELMEGNGHLDLRTALCDVREPLALERLFASFRPQVVFHAAACKHVPMMEHHPLEAVRTNIFGTWNLLLACRKRKVERFLFVSTDKAACPLNIMGATKWIGERLVQEAGRTEGVPYVSVRFGNVLGSRGSVVPVFERQIRNGGPVRVTHREATRYFMTIPEAVQLILQADALRAPGRTFILDMGEPVRILDLARQMVKLSGLKPDENIEIRIVGLRPGEKLHEQLYTPQEKLSPTAIPHLNELAAAEGSAAPGLSARLADLREALNQEDEEGLKKLLWELVPTS